MKTIAWIIIFLLLGIGTFFITINIHKDSNQTPIESDLFKVEVKKRFDENGKLKADVEVINGINHGIAHNYYPNGKVHSEISYKNGLKDGNSIWFYENGKPYRITPFSKGKIQGIQQKFYSSGKLMADIPYINDSLIEGTKEYSESGKLLVEKLPFQIKQILSDNNTRLFIEITAKKLEVIEDVYATYDFHGKARVAKPSRDGKQLIIPISVTEKIQPKVTVNLIYNSKMNNLKRVSYIFN